MTSKKDFEKKDISSYTKEHRPYDSYSVILGMGYITEDTDLLKMVPVEILLNFENYFRTLQLGFCNFLSGIVFLHY